jgi:hypothetical protein
MTHQALKGRNKRMVNTSLLRPFRARITSINSNSWGVALGYFVEPLRGVKRASYVA